MTDWMPRINRTWLEVKKTEEELKQENRKQYWLEDLWARRPLWSLQGQQPVAPTTLPYSTMQVPTPMADLGKAFAVPIAGSMLKARAEGKSVPEIISAPLIQLGKPPVATPETYTGLGMAQPKSFEQYYQEWQPPSVTLPRTKNPILNFLSGFIMAQPTETGETELSIKSAIELIPWLLLPAGKNMPKPTAVTRLGEQSFKIEQKLVSGQTLTLAERNILRNANEVESILSRAIKQNELPADITNYINQRLKLIKSGAAGGTTPPPEPIKPEIPTEGKIIPEKVTPVTGEVTPPIKPPTITTKGLPENPVVRNFYDFVKKLNTEKWWVRSEIKTGHKAQTAALEQLQQSGLSGRELYQAELKVLGGKLKPDITAPEMTPQNINELFNIVNKAELKGRLSNVDLKNALDDMFGLSTDPKKFGRFVRPQPHQIDGLTQIFGKELGVELLKTRKMSDIVFDRIMSVSNIPRVLQTMLDHSAVLRQNFILSVSHPQLTWKNIGASLKSLKDPKIAESAMKGVENNKYYDDANSILKVYRAPIEGEKQFALLSEMEEAFQTGVTTSKNPILRKIFAPARLSERIYNLYGNLQRYSVTYKVMGDMEKAGLYGQWIESAQAKNLGQLINWASGRGSLPKFLSGKGAVVMNQILYSPRYQASLLEYPYMAIKLLFSKSTSRPIRLETIRQLVSSIGVGTAILAMINQSGVVSVEADPRSTDFGKIRVGNTRINFWGGFQTWARFLTQLATNERKTTTTGNIVGLNREQTAIRFWRGKESPLLALIHDLFAGQTYIGEEFTTEKEFVGQQAYNRLAPLFIQDIIDAIRNDGWLGGFLAAPGFFGTTIISYKETGEGGYQFGKTSKTGIEGFQFGATNRKDIEGFQFGRKK